MNILVVNCGSSSLKYQLIEMDTESVLAKGICERIGINDSFVKHTSAGKEQIKIEKNMPDHMVAFQEVVNILTDTENGVINNMDEITAVGHRVVHGAEEFCGSMLITDAVMNALKECSTLAPLHNPPNITGIKACQKIMPNTPNIGVFDTSFHQTLPPKAFLYAIPYSFYEKYKLRKYGFHGTSHKYVAERAASILGKPLSELKIVTCHLGNGSSVCAVDGGKSVDTSMGFTPLEGLPMGTRSGSLDPAVVEFIAEKENMTVKEVTNLLNKKSGVLGISGLSSDFRDLEIAAEEGHQMAGLALDIFEYRVRKYIGEYAAAMEGLDAVVFTGGVGENNPILRTNIAKSLAFMGFSICEDLNKLRGKELDISTPEAKTKMLVIPTNEELAIAREAKRISLEK